MGKKSSFKAKDKIVNISLSKKLHDTVVKAEKPNDGVCKKAIKSALVSSSVSDHKIEIKNTSKSNLKKKRKRNLVAANDPTYADCFSDGEDEAFEKKRNGSSLDEAVKSIMSEGGSMQPNGELLRPKKAVKRKRKNKNCSLDHEQVVLKGPHNKGEECSLQAKVPAANCTAGKDDQFGESCIENLSPVQKKKRKDTCKILANEANSSSSSYDSKITEIKNGDNVQSCNDELLMEISMEESLAKKPKKEKKKSTKTNNSSSLEIHGRNNRTDKIVDSSCDLTPVTTNSAVNEADQIESGTTPDVQACINTNYSCKSFSKKLRKAWRGRNIEDWPEGSTVLHTPFNCAHLPDFINPSCDLLHRLKKELHSLLFTFRNNDIFKFRQSGELPLSGACLQLRQLLTGAVRDWLISCTRIELADTIDLSASLYLHSDSLLCHDDELEGRRIAFILYLTDEDDNWRPSDGGSLDLFDGEPGLAGRLVRRLSPHFNTFAFFEVSPLSFHQVSEVLSPTKARLSVSGWFHGPPLQYPPRPSRPLKLFFPPAHVEESVFFSWISPVYLAESLQSSIRRQLVQDSEIQLDTFFVAEKFEELSEALRCVDTWRWAGPPTSAHYEVCGATVPDVVRDFMLLMRSEAFFLVLSQLTGVPLHRLSPPEDEDGDESSSDADNNSSDGDDMEDEEADSGTEEPTLQTLKRVLKDYKKKRSLSASETLDSNFSLGLDKEWLYDLGLPCLTSSACINSVDCDLTTGSSESVNLKKKTAKNKKLKIAKLEQNEAVKSNEQVSRHSDTILEGSHGDENSASVFCSIRRLSHGCYSLIRDDDNDSSSGGSYDTAELNVHGIELNGGTTAEKTQDSNCQGRKPSGEDQTNGIHKDSKKQVDMTQKKSKRVSEVGGIKTKEKNVKELSHEERKRSTKSVELEDKESEDGGNYVLDVSLFCNVPDDYRESCGGYTAYVGQHDQEQLLSVVPQNNSLALVYRDHRTHSFIKHINATAGAASFHQIFCQYRES
ncbi:Oxoglutarate/iron-dependent oxygenase C-terminal degradation domain [Trinorchestia longiramus]|nr:Oxoglutarate/iron-dependent oxygenase C-terminal degradation domain [Trinorchestia longiramus]